MANKLIRLADALYSMGLHKEANCVDKILKIVVAGGPCSNKQGWTCVDGYPNISVAVGPGDIIILGDSQVGGELGRNLKGTRYLSNSSTVDEWVSYTAPGSGFSNKLINASKIYIILGGNGGDLTDEQRAAGASRGSVTPNSARGLIQNIRSVAPNAKVSWITPAPPAAGSDDYNDRKDDRELSNQNIIDGLIEYSDVNVINSHEIIREKYHGESWPCNGCHDGIHLSGEPAKHISDAAKNSP